MEPIAVLNESSAHRGEAGGWEQLVTRYDRPLGVAVRRALARFGLGLQRERVEDTVQEVWCRLFEAGPRPVAFHGRSEREATVYLGRVARSVVVDQLRNRRAAKRGGDWQRVGAADPGGRPRRAGRRSGADPRAAPAHRRAAAAVPRPLPARRRWRTDRPAQLVDPRTVAARRLEQPRDRRRGRRHPAGEHRRHPDPPDEGAPGHRRRPPGPAPATEETVAAPASSLGH